MPFVEQSLKTANLFQYGTRAHPWAWTQWTSTGTSRPGKPSRSLPCTPTWSAWTLDTHTFSTSWDRYTLRRKSHFCIPFLGIARPQLQFPHSCACERFIHSQDWSTYFLQQNRQIHRGNVHINRSQTHECGNWDCGRAIPFLGIFVSNFRYWFFAVHRYTQKNFRNACYQVGFCTEGISTGATPQDKYCKW